MPTRQATEAEIRSYWQRQGCRPSQIHIGRDGIVQIYVSASMPYWKTRGYVEDYTVENERVLCGNVEIKLA